MRAEYTAAALRINVRTDADIETAVEEGRCLKADTIDELLAQIEGIDVETAKASIDRYNELAKAGGTPISSRVPSACSLWKTGRSTPPNAAAL